MALYDERHWWKAADPVTDTRRGFEPARDGPTGEFEEVLFDQSPDSPRAARSPARRSRAIESTLFTGGSSLSSQSLPSACSRRSRMRASPRISPGVYCGRRIAASRRACRKSCSST